MADYTDVNAWSADKCGVVQSTNFWSIIKKNILLYKEKGKWTIEDARCREVFRNWWLDQDGNRSVLFGKIRIGYSFSKGFIARHDEIACIIAIWESEK